MGERPRGHEAHVEPGADARLMRTVLDRLSLGVAILSVPDLAFEYVNPAFQAFAPGKELVGRTAAEAFPEMDSLTAEVLEKLEAAGGRWREENAAYRVRRSPDGPLETVYGTFELSRIEIAGVVHHLVVARETTERVRLERENVQLHEEEMRRLAFAETLASVHRVIHSSLDYDQVMQRALEEATKALGADSGAVFVGLDGESEARYVFGFPRAFLGRRFSADIFPFSRMMEESRDPIPIPAERMGELMNPMLARLFRVRSLLAIPIVIRGRLTGGIGLVYRHPHEFVGPEIDFARSFGASVSLALENAELYRKQERVADTLQRALLTLPERVHGLRFAHAYRSATEAVQVGGDFYDLFELEHETVGLTLGDIAGKGLDAAVLTSLVKNAIRVQATEQRHSAADVMRVVNTVLLGASEPEEFATVFFGLLDCRSGRLAYCNAGHTTSALICRGEEVERLASNSSLVGALADSEFHDSWTTIEGGDLLFMYSDGLTEARAGKEQYGEERLFDLMARLGDVEPAEAVDAVVAEVTAFSGGELTDDIAVLAVKRQEGPVSGPSQEG